MLEQTEERVQLLDDEETGTKYYPEPVSHAKNYHKSCVEKMKGCLGDSKDGNDLTLDERNAFGALKDDFKVSFDSKKKPHFDLLRELYNEQLKDQSSPPADEETLATSAWNDIGFQGVKPETDFRGGGLQGLKDIVNFTRVFEEKFKEMKKETADGRYFFACNSIGVTFLLKIYFHMNNPEASHEEPNIAPRKAFKNFCRMISNTNKPVSGYQTIHTLVLRSIFDLWIAACNNDSTLTIADSGSAEKVVVEQFKKLLEKKDFISIQEFEDEFKTLNMSPKLVTKLKF